MSFLGMTLPIYFNLGAELIYPIGEAHGTTLFTSGMNFFGLLIIELTKVIDLQNNGLLWTGVFQGGLLFFGLVFLIGRVERLKPTSNYSLLNTRGGGPIIQQNVCGGDSSRASICIKILKYNTRFLFENVVNCSKILIYNSSRFRKC